MGVSNVEMEAFRNGITKRTKESMDWFRRKAQAMLRVNRNTMRQEERIELRSRQVIGNMYMFFYDPKHKDTLPYYDQFPLIFVLEKYKDGFLGMNLHYLPPVFRARLMDRLYAIERQDNLRESKKLRLSYGLLNGVAKYKYFKPTVKRYLNSQVRSRFLWIPYEEWDIALMLPTQRFKKSKQNVVWKESKQLIQRS